MSLNDIAEGRDELDDLAPGKKGKFSKNKGLKRTKVNKTMIILVMGIIIGLLIGHYLAEPFLVEEQGNTLQECNSSKDLLSKENDCLYSALDDPQSTLQTCFGTVS